VDDMSSERFRERLLSGDQLGMDGSQFASTRAQSAAAALSSVHLPLQRLVADAPLPRSASWQPQNWRLRTKLLALTFIPMLLALVLGALRIRDAVKHSHSTAIRDSVIIGAAVLLALILLVLLARSILKPLRILRASAFDVADRRLPAVIELLRTTGGRDKGIKIDPVPVYSREDVGQVARAFDAVHGEAVRLATEQAVLRANVNDMFVNLSRRSQGLVERQLRLIDDLELGEQDSDRLAALFRLDHLATRMRRNGENLLVLAGAELRQRSGQPVPIVDVLRAALSEIEEYQRVTMQQLPSAMVSGLAVNDIVHLVAELLDNATAYSSPESLVTLSARFAEERGFTIEISDEGAGMPPARLTAINQQLATPAAVDASVSRQMGLFVVGRLANRHGITVQLSSAEGLGVTVTVTLPKALVAAELAGAGERTDFQGRSYSQPATLGPGQDGDPFRAPAPSLNSQPSGSLLDQHGLLDDFSDITKDAGDTPIFEAMLSRWFTEQPEPAAAAEAESSYSVPLQDTAAHDEGWESEADAGWQAAAAASVPTADEMTAAGLPKRRPQAFLVPGSVGSRAVTTEPPAASAARNADAARGRMSSFQRGLTLGRHSRSINTADQLGPGGGVGRHSRSASSAEQVATDGDEHDEQIAGGTW
jgi:signal transduction histidine kinase